jgi:prophage regulatory protein
MSRVLRRREVTALTGLSESTLWREEKAGRFPARRKLTGGVAVGWLDCEVQSYLDNRQVVTKENIKPVAPHSKRGRKPKASTRSSPRNK